ncbi:hypothetical protein D0839_02290 [Bordetella avium]|nr:hypothetical protein C0J09_05235 [Bordetella avium]AZY51984.1 hypothetical protein C0J07_05300 [Bordetella avium]RIQ17014.1 hypothetical protein D0850_12065 [Bordetella avium]RIQ36259.1 hypothetical protein D0849_00855 [Bordetella avium]RIQ39608.1 hypothetical protein D0848_04435 [Bordetella avium]
MWIDETVAVNVRCIVHLVRNKYSTILALLQAACGMQRISARKAGNACHTTIRQIAVAPATK